MPIKKRVLWIIGFFIVISIFHSHPAYAADNISLIFSGVAKLIGTALQVPATILRSSVTGFPFGIIGGAINGSLQAISGVLGGGMDIARGSAPYAKYAALAL